MHGACIQLLGLQTKAISSVCERMDNLYAWLRMPVFHEQGQSHAELAAQRELYEQQPAGPSTTTAIAEEAGSTSDSVTPAPRWGTMCNAMQYALYVYGV